MRAHVMQDTCERTKLDLLSLWFAEFQHTGQEFESLEFYFKYFPQQEPPFRV